MYDNVYILDDEPKYNPVDIKDYLVYGWGVKSASEDNRKDWMEKDLKRLSSRYKIAVDIIEIDNRIMGRINKSELITVRKRTIKEKVEQIKQELKDPINTDALHIIAGIAYYNKEILFYSNPIMTVVSIVHIRFLKYLQNNSKPYIYVVTAWTYSL